MKTQSKLSVYLVLLILIIVWALSWPVSKIGFGYISPLWFGTLRIIISLVVIVGLLLVRRQLFWPKPADWPLILSLGIFQMGIFMVLINLGLAHVPAGRSAILTYTTPLWVVPIAVFWFKESWSIFKLIGLLLGVFGLILLFSPWEVNWHDRNALVGNALLISAAISWAIAILAARYSRWHSTPLLLLPWQLLIALVIVLVTAILFEPKPTVHWNLTLLATLFYTGIFATAFGYWSAITVSKQLPATTTSLAMLGVPICGLLFAHWILSEALTITTLTALCAIVLGLGCIFWSNHKQNRYLLMND